MPVADARFAQAGSRAVASVRDGPATPKNAMRRTAGAVEYGARRLGLLCGSGPKWCNDTITHAHGSVP